MTGTTAAAPPASTAYVGLGANLGEARQTVLQAIDALSALPGTLAFAASPLYETEAIGADGPDYVNAVARIETLLSPHELLAELQRIEAAHGRERSYRNAPRTLDLDLLLHGEHRIDSPELTVPHPRMHERAFVLRPLSDLDPHVIVPGRGDARTLLAAVEGQRIRQVNR
jgi:2-amino-4-hydroxy-6-hydroxymethyldihydropteridine diphosphokinase